jgi:hypothetical protein
MVAGLFAIVFQTGMRYRYEKIGGALWRIDQVTNQRCRIASKGAACAAPASSTSISKSPSISISTSTSLR